SFRTNGRTVQGANDGRSRSVSSLRVVAIADLATAQFDGHVSLVGHELDRARVGAGAVAIDLADAIHRRAGAFHLPRDLVGDDLHVGARAVLLTARGL